jgi:hypothetical protein
MKGYGAISALDVFKFQLSLGKGRTEANLTNKVWQDTTKNPLIVYFTISNLI